MLPFEGSLRDAWRGEADAWAAWASTPEHDGGRLGFQDLVTKPILVSQLYGSVMRVVGEAALAEERPLRFG